MPGMRRRLFTILSALSLVLCLATCVLWVRSYRAYDGISRDVNITGPSTGILSISGRLIVYHFASDYPNPPKAKWEIGPADPVQMPDLAKMYDFSDFPHFWNRIGFVVNRYLTMEGPVTAWDTASVPDWFVLAIWSFLPVIVVLRHLRRQRRVSTNACVVCGYDLRATPNRCPECGTETKTPASAAGGNRTT
jgi:hypothetical protein